VRRLRSHSLISASTLSGILLMAGAWRRTARWGLRHLAVPPTKPPGVAIAGVLKWVVVGLCRPGKAFGGPQASILAAGTSVLGVVGRPHAAQRGFGGGSLVQVPAGLAAREGLRVGGAACGVETLGRRAPGRGNGLIGILGLGVGLEGVPGCHLILGLDLGLDWPLQCLCHLIVIVGSHTLTLRRVNPPHHMPWIDRYLTFNSVTLICVRNGLYFGWQSLDGCILCRIRINPHLRALSINAPFD